MGNDTFLELVGSTLTKYKNNWKDNPNRFTGIIKLVAVALTPEQRQDLNLEIRNFEKRNKGIRFETAEKICYNSFLSSWGGANNFVLRHRRKSEFGHFDVLKSSKIDTLKLERELNQLTLFALVLYKECVADSGLRFEHDEINLSDLPTGKQKII